MERAPQTPEVPGSHPVWLSFPRYLERQYCDFYFEKVRGPLRLASITTTVALIALFGVSFPYYLPQIAVRPAFIASELVALATSIAYVAYTHFNKSYRHYELVMILGTMVMQGAFCVLFLHLPRAWTDACYTVGLLVMLSNYTWLGLRLRAAALLGFISAVLMVGTLLATGQFPTINGGPVLMLVHTVGIQIFGYVAARSTESQARQEFILRAQLEAEQRNSERLLLNTLPRGVTSMLKSGAGTIADYCSEVSVLFADLVGFTELSARLPPREVVAALDHLFSRFDDLCLELGVEKIKTIGDAYMAVCGVPSPRADHAARAADLALRMLDEVRLAREALGLPLALRVGINTGPAVAGVIGKSKFSYDLWGDTVNVASRIESQGEADAILVSSTTRALLEGEFEFGAAQTVRLKGKGDVAVSQLIGRRLAAPPVAA